MQENFGLIFGPYLCGFHQSGSGFENCSENWFSHGSGRECNPKICSENAPEFRQFGVVGSRGVGPA